MARRYARDNRGRFSSTGATARGGRLATASGKKRATVTTKAADGSPKGTIGKPRGLKAQSGEKLRKGIAYNRLAGINARIGNRPDIAQQHIPGRFRGQAGKRMDASIDRAVKQVKAAEQARLMKPKAQVKAERAAKAEANRQAAAAKPKRIRSAESLRTSRAKQIEKRRSITTNPAGERASAAAKMAANAARTQQRATAFYKANASKKSTKAASKPVRSRSAVGKIDNAKADRIIQRHDAMRPGLRPATGSKARSMNSINTFLRARKFLLEPSRKVAKKGETISGQESTRRAVASASKKTRKRK